MLAEHGNAGASRPATGPSPAISATALNSYVNAVEAVRLPVNQLLEQADPILDGYREHRITPAVAAQRMGTLEQRFAAYLMQMTAITPADTGAGADQRAVRPYVPARGQLPGHAGRGPRERRLRQPAGHPGPAAAGHHRVARPAPAGRRPGGLPAARRHPAGRPRRNRPQPHRQLTRPRARVFDGCGAGFQCSSPDELPTRRSMDAGQEKARGHVAAGRGTQRERAPPTTFRVSTERSWRWRESNPRPSVHQQGFSGRSLLCFSQPRHSCRQDADGLSHCLMSRTSPVTGLDGNPSR